MIEIYGSNGRLKCQVEAGSSSQQDKALQSDNVLSLSFTHYAFLELDVNDWCEFAGERYWLQEKYLPKQKNEHEWEYNVKLYGIESLIKRLLVLQNSDGENEAVFTLTAPASEHVRLIVASINAGLGSGTNWKVGDVVATENLTIDYDGTYCDEGLRLVAEAAGTEWWIEGETVNLCRCEQGEELVLRYGESLLSLERDEADGVKFYTRLFPIGSSRNIDRSEYGSTRLQLPGGAKYVDIPDLVERYGVFHHYEQEAFSGIYPRRVGVISSVRWEEVEDTEGTSFTVWHFRDEGLTFDPNDYEIGGLVKHVTFQSGELAGRDFEVNYSSLRGEFEIVTTWPYDDDTQLPDVHGGQLVPEAGDTYILWNIRMPDEYYGLAEQEFLSAVEAYNREHLTDRSVYKAPTNPKWVERSGAQLHVGRRVRLESRQYFPEPGYRSSRITRVSRRVSDPCQMELEVSDAVSTGTMAKIEDSIRDVKVYVRESSGVLPDIIRSWDETRPTDNNLYSARRTHREFLSKKQADRAEEVITFEKGLVADGMSRMRGIVNAGDLEFAGGGDFEEGVSGARVWPTQDGWHGQVDYLTVTKKWTARELEVMHQSHIGGSLAVSAAECRADRVDGSFVEEWGFWTVYFLAEDADGRKTYNKWAVGDMALCETLNLSGNGTAAGAANHWWWRKVEAVSEGPVTLEDGRRYHWIALSVGDCAAGSDAPAAGDEIVQCGNCAVDGAGNYTATERQGVIMLTSAGGSVSGGSVPFIRIYRGVGTEERNGAGVVTRSKWVMPRARIDLNPQDPRLDVSSLSITATEDGVERTRALEEYLAELERGGLMVICGDTADAPTTDSEFMASCLEQLGLETAAEMAGAFYVTSEWRVWQYRADGVWVENTDAYLRELLGSFEFETDDEGRRVVKNISKSGLVTEAGFSELFSRAVNSGTGGVVTEARVRTYVDGAVSGVEVSADRVRISSGSETLGDYFSLMNGSIWCQDLTVEGVVNNLVKVIDVAEGLNTRLLVRPTLDGVADVVPVPPGSLAECYCLDVLCCGSVVELRSVDGNVLLPYYIGDGYHTRMVTMYGGEAHLMTARELMMMVGRRLTVMTDGEPPAGYSSGYYLYAGPRIEAESVNGLGTDVVNNSLTVELAGGGVMAAFPLGTDGCLTLEFRCGMMDMDGARHYGTVYYWGFCNNGGRNLPEWE